MTLKIFRGILITTTIILLCLMTSPSQAEPYKSCENNKYKKEAQNVNKETTVIHKLNEYVDLLRQLSFPTGLFNLMSSPRTTFQEIQIDHKDHKVQKVHKECCSELTKPEEKDVYDLHIIQAFDKYINHVHKCSPHNQEVVIKYFQLFKKNYIKDMEKILLGTDVTKTYNCVEEDPDDLFLYYTLQKDFPEMKRECADTITCAIMYHYHEAMKNVENEHPYPKEDLVCQVKP